MDLSDRQAMYNGFGNSLSRAVELVLTPAIFGFFGWLLDRWLGVTPLFTITLTLLVFLYVAWRLWSGYESDMKAHERNLSGRLAGGTSGPGTEVDP